MRCTFTLLLTLLLLLFLQVCPITAIFEYFALFPEVLHDPDGRVYPGADTQNQRFGEILDKILLEHEEEVNALGYKCDEIGVHSIRKGATTYASSGTTAAPSTVSINV